MAPAATETTEPLIVPPVWADAVAANDRDNSAIAMPSRVKVLLLPDTVDDYVDPRKVSG